MATPDKAVKKQESPPAYTGHRSRVRARFIRNGFDGMEDYEVLEALLMQVLPRKDVKPLSRSLLERFGTVSGVLSQPLYILKKIPGLGETSAVGLKMFNDIGQFCLQEQCFQQSNLIHQPNLIYKFARMKMGSRRHESYMMLFLDSNCHLIEYRVIAEGTVNYVIAYLRNIMEMAVEIGAANVILIHNHPSGVCRPSDEDVATTREICKALRTIEIDLLDHVIVTHDEHFSFHEHKLDFKS